MTPLGDELRAAHEAMARAACDEARACFERAIAREPARAAQAGEMIRGR